jgi:hypothetical protein
LKNLKRTKSVSPHMGKREEKEGCKIIGRYQKENPKMA